MEKELATIVEEEIDEEEINKLYDTGNVEKLTKSKSKKMGTFQKMGISKAVQSGILKMGFKLPTPIQRETIPIALTGKDVVAMARTGSGKTAAFIIPMVEKLKEHASSGGVRGIVLSPTRELAYQSYRVCTKISHYTSLRSVIIVGGEAIEQQFEALSRNPDIIFATPGRLMHLLMEIPDFSLNSVQFICYDEADQLFELGFAPQLNEICRRLTNNHQSMLISATLPSILLEFTRAGLKDPEMIRLDTDNKLSPTLCSTFFITREEDKAASLIFLFRNIIPDPRGTLIFVATRQRAEYISSLLNASDIRSTAIYGTMEFSSRVYNLSLFQKNQIPVLVVTDVAARGLDIPIVNTVIHYDCPSSPKLFVHRTGRTARGGREGNTVVLLNTVEIPYFLDILLFLGQPIQTSTTPYSWEDLKPDVVHYGYFPPSLIDRVTHSIQQTIEKDLDLHRAWSSAENSYELYDKSRPKPSKASIHRVKSVKVSVIHPLLLTFITEDQIRLEKAKEEIHGYRPTATIWEIERGRGKSDMMVKKRKMHQWSIEKNREEQKMHEEEEEKERYLNEHEMERAEEGHIEKEERVEHGKPHISKKMRERLKKKGESINVKEIAQNTMKTEEVEKSYRDEQYYINPEMPVTHDAEEFLNVHNDDVGKLTASVNNALFELMPDDAESITNRKKIVRWDKKHGRYVRGSVGELKDNKNIRNESGQLIEGKSKMKRGELYAKWRKTHKKNEQAIGEEMPEKADFRRGRRGFMKSEKSEGRDEVKTRDQIRKQLKEKEKNKIKQMSKKDRAVYLKKNGEAKGKGKFMGKRRK